MNRQDSENLWRKDYFCKSEVYGESEHFIAWQISENITLIVDETDVYNILVIYLSCMIL